MSELTPYYYVRMTERQVRTLKETGIPFMRTRGLSLEEDITDANEWSRLLYELHSILRNIEEAVDVNDS
jgi:hypothetical protein